MHEKQRLQAIGLPNVVSRFEALNLLMRFWVELNEFDIDIEILSVGE